MSMLIQHHMAAWNAERQFNITTKAKAKKTEKLSSGYKINRAADDAAGLAISEKMRRQIRGLRQGTENAQDGISWVQIGEGALNEAHDILQRMNELTIKAQNGTNTAADREYIQAEFDQLQTELDRISDTTTFNELPIFDPHEPVYDQVCGNIHWDDMEPHEIVAGKNQLIIEYQEEEDPGAAKKTLTLEVPAGSYTTHELIDALDDAAGLDGPIHIEYMGDGRCCANLENGAYIHTISGDLSYLFWETYDGGGYGALIGTTEFEDPDSPAYALKIVENQNDSMEFEIEYFDGSGTDKVEINLFQRALAAGYSAQNTSEGRTLRLTKTQLMNLIDNAVPSKTGLKTDHYGKAIMLSSDLGIITKFKGNMFKIENTNPIYTSTFYDNIQYGYVEQDPAFVVGGAVLTTDSRDKEHNRYYIDSTNNTLVLQPNLTTAATTITIPTKPADANDPANEGYTAQQMVDELNQQFQANGIDGEVRAYLVKAKQRVKFPDGSMPDGSKTATTADRESVGDDYVYFEGVEIRTVKEGPDAIVRIDKDKSTAYDTLFTIKNYNVYGAGLEDATINNETRVDKNAYFQSARNYGATDKITIKNGVNDRFKITLKSKDDSGAYDFDNASGKTYTIDILASGSRSMTGSEIAAEIQKQINNNAELKNRIEAKFESGKVIIRDKEDLTLNNANDKYLNWNTEISITNDGNNVGYRDIFQEKYTYDVNYTVSGRGTLKITNDGNTDGSGMWITINGNREWFPFNGNTTLTGAAAQMNKKTPITFTENARPGSNNPQDFTASGAGYTGVTHWDGDFAQGDSKEVQGKPGLSANEPAKLTMEPKLKSSMKVETGKNDKITLAINGVKKTLTLAAGTYDMDGLAGALQNAINDTTKGFGTGFGGASVDVDSNGYLVITAALPPGSDGKTTSIRSYGQGEEVNTFFDSLNRTQTKASCTTNLKLADNVTLTDGVNDTFSFTYRDSTGSHSVTLNLVPEDDGTTTATFTTAEQLLDRIRDRLTKDKNTDGSAINVEASLTNGCLTLTTKEAGNGTSISYSAVSTDGNADTIFGGLTKPTAARTILNRNVVSKATYTGTRTFSFTLDGTLPPKSVSIAAWDNSVASKRLDKLLNDAFNAQGIRVTASLENGKLCLTKKDAGSGSIHIDYNSGGTAITEGHMFGFEAKPGVTISTENSGKTLVIKGQPGDRISVSYTDSGGTMATKKAVAYIDPRDTTASSYDTCIASGFHSAKYSTVTSVALNKDGIKLDKWNSDLQFTFTEGTGQAGTAKPQKKVDIRLKGKPDANGVTSLADIQAELQAEIDKQVGAGAIEVLLDKDHKLIFKSKKPGAEFQFSDMRSSSYSAAYPDRNKVGGGFFHHVMCRYTTTKGQLDDPADINGDQRAENIFAQGRHNVKLDLTKLKPGVSDTLTLDLTFIADTDHNGTLSAAEKANEAKITLTMKLDPNAAEDDYYDGDSLKKMIQKKLDDAIMSTEVQAAAKNLGVELHEGLIEVDIGRHKTDIYGNMDDVSLSFTITKNPDIAVPHEGYFYIDGIGGNAAYETFYHTVGELIPAYIIGTKNIEKGVVLDENDNEMVFEVDGVEQKVDLSMFEKGVTISAEDIVKELTKQFEADGVPLAAEVTKKGFLKISHKRMGKHTIEKVTGNARDTLFYTEHVDKREKKNPYIRVSSSENDRIDLYSPHFSTTMLRINSCCVSTIKNAEKATERLKAAMSKVSEMRTNFGALQNRIEHTINNNQNKEENTQAAESQIRDADIAKEVMEYSNLNIIQQAGQAILAQANQSRDGMLALLG